MAAKTQSRSDYIDTETDRDRFTEKRLRINTSWLTSTWGYQPVSPCSTRSSPDSPPKVWSSPPPPCPRTCPTRAQSRTASSFALCSRPWSGSAGPRLSPAAPNQRGASRICTGGAFCVAGGCSPPWRHKRHMGWTTRTMWLHTLVKRSEGPGIEPAGISFLEASRSNTTQIKCSIVVREILKACNHKISDCAF